MLSSAKNYAVVSERMEDDLNGTEENQDDSSTVYCRESLLTNSRLSDDVQTQNAQVINSDLDKLGPNSDEALQEDWEETSDNTVGEEEFSDNQMISETDKLNKDAENLTIASGVPAKFVESSRESNEFPSEKTNQCTSPSDSSENLLSSSQRREVSVEDSDEVFPLVVHKANSADDLLDKNFVKWASTGGNSLRTNRDKDSAQSSESPSSDVEFSACSSVTSCTEDSGISSTVRDDELEEIPLNSSRFSPELYKQMSRLSVDESVAAWIPKSSNTYAPSPNAKVMTDSTDGGKSQKQSKLKWVLFYFFFHHDQYICMFACNAGDVTCPCNVYF